MQISVAVTEEIEGSKGRTLQESRPHEPFPPSPDVSAADAADTVAFEVVGQGEEGEVGGQKGEGYVAGARGEGKGEDGGGCAGESEACESE